MVSTRKLEIQITGDTAGASRAFGSIDSAADRTESRMSKWSGRIAAAIGAAFAVEAIVDWGATLINAAEEAEQVSNQTVAVLKSMGDAAGLTAKDVADLAESISLKTGLDDEMIQSGENVLLTFGNIRDEVGESNDVFTRATKVTTDMSVALGQDLQSSVVQVGKALNDPIAGLSALARVGVQFTEDQKAMIEQLVATGDTLGAQKIILEELERQFGGSAEAQATASDKLRVAWDNVQEQLGTALLPIFEKVATWLAETLPGAIDTAITWIEENETTVKNLAIAFGVILVGALVAYIVHMGLAAAATLLATWPILLAIGLIAALAYGLYYAYQNWGWFRTGVDTAVQGLQGFIGIVKESMGWIDRLTDKMHDLLGMSGFVKQASGIVPKVPRFDVGGTVPGPVGSPQLILAHGGETVLPTHRTGMTEVNGHGIDLGGGPTYQFHFHGPVASQQQAERWVVEALNRARDKGIR